MLNPGHLRVVKVVHPILNYTRPVYPLLSPLTTKSTRVIKAWQVSVAFYANLTAAALILNLSLTLWVVSCFPSDNGIVTLIEGDCSRVSQWDTWLHLPINVLNIILLGGSNHTMQCLVSPTRMEIDKAHAKGSWLDVGVPSTKNLFKVDRKRSVLWFLIAFTSIPSALV